MEAEYYKPDVLRYLEKKVRWVKIGKILSFVQYGTSLPLNEEGAGYKIFRLNEIEDCFLTKPEKWVVLPKHQYESLRLEKDDILFCRTNGNIKYVGRTGILKENVDAVFASYLIRIRPNKNYVLPEYLTIYLNTKVGRAFIERQAMHSNQFNVSAEQLKKIPIPLFDLEFQHQIKTLVNRAALYRNHSNIFYSKAENLLLEELGLKDFKLKYELSYTANLSQAFSAHRLDAEYFQPVYHKLIKYLKDNFEVKPLKIFILDFQKGIEVGSENYQEEGKLFIRVSNLSIHGFVERDQKYIDDELYRKLRDAYEPKVGDFLLTKDATPGIAYVVKEPIEGIIASGILKLTIDENKIDKEYLALCINSIIGKLQIERDGGGSVIIHWKPEQIKNLQIPVLPHKTQRKIAELVKQSHEARRKAKELLEEAKRKVEKAIENEINKYFIIPTTSHSQHPRIQQNRRFIPRHEGY